MSKNSSSAVRKKSDDLPATNGALKGVRNELKTNFRSLDHKIDSVRSELKGDIAGVKTGLSQVKAQVQEVLGAVYRMQTLFEEQRGENRIVLDGLKSLFQRQ